MTHVRNRADIINSICDEYKTIYRIVYQEGKPTKFNSVNVKAFFDTVRDEIKSLSELNVPFIQDFLNLEKNNGINGDFLELFRQHFENITSLFSSTGYLSIGSDIAFSLLVEDETMSQTEIYSIFTKIKNVVGETTESSLLSKTIGGTMTLVFLQNSVFTAVLNTHES